MAPNDDHPQSKDWKKHPELLHFARRFAPGAAAEGLMQTPELVIARVMNSGGADDIARLITAVGEDALRRVIQNAKSGMFDEMSWRYWHHRLGLARAGNVPSWPGKI